MKSKLIETAEDDRVIGIPHVMTTSGDKIYIINGRVMSGWSMYFSLTCIKSPENYTQIVDIVYNVSYILASIEKRANLSLGARFDVVDDPLSTSDDKAIGFVRKLLFDRLNMNGRFLKKVSAHLDIYGNSYVHIRRDRDGVPNKLTILQPERLKIFLDPMTTKILFYVYLPPIIGGTVLVPYPYEKPNPNLIQNIALTYPTPIIVPPEDILHLKQRDWTEYPFGYSLMRACMEPAQARLDYTIISPIIYKHYSKPIIHWQLDPTGLNPTQVTTRMTAMQNNIENLEPTSDVISTNRWSSNVITGVSKGFSSIFDMIADNDTQIFASLGVPETYFKPRGTTDRMVAEQDKIFIKEMKDRQEYFAEEIKKKIVYPALAAHLGVEEEDVPHVRIQWRKMIMTDESIEIQNTIALLQSGVIDMPEARRRLSLPPTAAQAQQDLVKRFVETPSDQMSKQLPPSQPVSMAGGPQPQQQAAAPQAAAPPPPAYLFQDEAPNKFARHPGESDANYYARLDMMAGPSKGTPNPKLAFADEEVHIMGPIGQAPEASGKIEPREHISDRRCPFCRSQMFELADSDGNTQHRCQHHGLM